MRKLILHHPLDLGDVVMMTPAVRDLHFAFPNEFQTDVRTRFSDVWLNNPYITPIADDAGERIEVGYPSINNPGSGAFADAFRLHLSELLNLKIPHTTMNPDIHLTDAEKQASIVTEKFGYAGKYWVINAGYKADVILKHYPFWQEVADRLKNKVQLVQIGAANDHHTPLENVFNLIGQTSIRELIRVIYQSEGTIGPISAQFVIAAAFNKPSVIVAGGKEPPRWQMFNNHRYLHVCGCLPCAPGNGCWTGKYQDCKSRVGDVPRCFAMISPDEVARNVLLYYDGGILKY